MLTSVAVGGRVPVGRGVEVLTGGTGVQVAGSLTKVGVEVGMSMVGTIVGGGNGLMDEVGFVKIDPITAMTITALISTSTERISQMLIFIVFPPYSR
jgi:hypothetical protein